MYFMFIYRYYLYSNVIIILIPICGKTVSTNRHVILTYFDSKQHYTSFVISKWLEMKCWLIFQMRKTIRYFSNRPLSYIQSFFIELKHMNKEKQRIWQLKKYFKGFSDSFLLSFCTFVKSFLPKSIQWHKYRNYPQRGMQIKYSLILSVVW